MFLRRISLLKDKITDSRQYPFSIPAIARLESIELKSNITFFVGENGSGKSTLLEAIAYQCGFNIAGGGSNNSFELEAAKSSLGDYIRLSWLPKINQGFFLRAESFYNFATYLDRMQEELPEFDFYGPYGGMSLHEQSHGESFLSLFLNRFDRQAIYLLDEPEAALSPTRQLSLLKVIYDLTKDNTSQFIIATHSPILLGYPEAQIINFNTSPISEITYEETDHYQITKGFLNRRELYLKELFKE